MRMVLSGLVAAGLLTSQMAYAECAPPVDRAALDVAGLKTQLMVITITCHTDAQYNAFVNKFKPELNKEERIAQAYFVRRGGQKGQDTYMTNLANTKSDAGLQLGNRFCAHNEGIFNEVMALRNGKELEEYAAGRATGTPTVMTTCTGSERPAATRASSTRRRGHR